MSSRLTVTTPAESRALITREAFKDELSISGTDDDAWIDREILAASGQIETYCGRVFALQEYRQDFRLGDRGESLVLTRWPANVDAITEDGAALTVDVDFEADRDTGIVRRICGGRPAKWPKGCKITVEFSAGYILPGDTGDDLPAEIERACIELVKLRYLSRDRDPTVTREVVPQVYDVTFQGAPGSAGAGSGSLPAPIAAMVEPFRSVSYE